jgi:hypothetical protein
MTTTMTMVMMTNTTVIYNYFEFLKLRLKAIPLVKDLYIVPILGPRKHDQIGYVTPSIQPSTHLLYSPNRALASSFEVS